MAHHISQIIFFPLKLFLKKKTKESLRKKR